MRSFKSLLINLLLRTLKTKKMFAQFAAVQDDPLAFQAEVQKRRDNGQSQPEPNEQFKQKYPYTEIDCDGSALHLHEIGAQKRVIFYLHGGAYVLGLGSAHWSLVEKLGTKADYHVAMFDYPLAPEHSCNTAIERTLIAYNYLVDRYGAENIIIMGDSAGGGLAAALCIYLRDHNNPLPAKLIMLYPWLDVTMSHPESRPIEPKDLLLGIDGLIACGKYYAGELDTDNPLVSPWFGEITGLPPFYFFSGTYDLLHPEARDFHQKAVAAGHPSRFYSYDKMQHAWLLFPMPEADKAVADICAVL